MLGVWVCVCFKEVSKIGWLDSFVVCSFANILNLCLTDPLRISPKLPGLFKICRFTRFCSSNMFKIICTTLQSSTAYVQSTLQLQQLPMSYGPSTPSICSQEFATPLVNLIELIAINRLEECFFLVHFVVATIPLIELITGVLHLPIYCGMQTGIGNS